MQNNGITPNFLDRDHRVAVYEERIQGLLDSPCAVCGAATVLKSFQVGKKELELAYPREVVCASNCDGTKWTHRKGMREVRDTGTYQFFGERKNKRKKTCKKKK
ncbi:MAG: hypothetical protein WC455_10125 [Dehalococcoidia bacterium]|jgi:hypothetical protein